MEFAALIAGTTLRSPLVPEWAQWHGSWLVARQPVHNHVLCSATTPKSRQRIRYGFSKTKLTTSPSSSLHLHLSLTPRQHPVKHTLKSDRSLFALFVFISFIFIYIFLPFPPPCPPRTNSTSFVCGRGIWNMPTTHVTRLSHTPKSSSLKAGDILYRHSGKNREIRCAPKRQYQNK